MMESIITQPASAKRSEYIPGVCNIGGAERARRRRSGIAGTVLALALLIFLLAIDAPPAWRLLLVLPVAAAASGFLQDAMHFCAAFGLKGIYNVINSAGITEDVELEKFRRKDRAKALQIAGLSLAIGAAAAGASLLI